jgi:hypothetical protein
MQPTSLIPQPPFGAVMDPTLQFWVTSVVAAATLSALIYAIIHWRSSGKPTFLLLFLSGGAMMIVEPLVDTASACWFPRVNSWVVFYGYGRPLPLWLCLDYFFYFGIGVGVTWQLMRRGLTRNQLWLLFAGGIIGDFVMEAILLHYNTYYYYGWQPLVVLKFPFWWGPVNSIIVMVAAAVITRFEAQLTSGWRQLQIIPILLTVSTGMNCAAGWPSWLVINTPVGPFLTQVGGIATFALSSWFMWMVIENIGVKSPAVAAPFTATRAKAI